MNLRSSTPNVSPTLNAMLIGVIVVAAMYFAREAFPPPLVGEDQRGGRAALSNNRAPAHPQISSTCATPHPQGVRKNARLSTGNARPHKRGRVR